MGTKNNPGNFDCYANAEQDEPMFVLLARDVHAPMAICQWVERRKAGGQPADDPQLQEALDCAAAMVRWREENRS